MAEFNPEPYVTGTAPEVKARQRMEIHIIHALLVAASAAGYTVRVDKGN